MKKHELTSRSDTEKRSQVLLRKSTQNGRELGGLNEHLKMISGPIGAETSLVGLVSILASLEFLHPANLGQRANIVNHLQQTYCNKHVQRTIQAKLRIDQPGDKYEQEGLADDLVNREISGLSVPMIHPSELQSDNRLASTLAQRVASALRGVG